MKNRVVPVVAVVALSAFWLGGVAAQEDKPGGAMPKPAWMNPTEAHAHLKASTGVWECQGEHWMAPGAPAMKFSGTAKREMILGGNYLQETFTSPMPDGVFEGRLIQGYDTAAKEHFSFWVDSMSPVPSVMRGTFKDGVMTMHGTEPNWMTGKPQKIRSVMKSEGNAKAVMTTYQIAEDGAERMSMRIVYTRKN